MMIWEKYQRIVTRQGREVQNPGKMQAVCQQVEAAIDGGKSVILRGPKGTGKTTVLQATYAYLKSRYNSGDGHEPFWFTEDELHAACKSDDLSSDGINVLLLDDLGTKAAERSYGNELQPVRDVIRRMYEAREGKWFAITHNLDHPQLVAHLGDRVVDRLIEVCTLIQVSTRVR